MATSPASPPASRTFLKDQAYEQIKREILTGHLASGVLLSERSLSERLNLGKAPIRDAINRLKQENFLSVVPQFGVMVKPVTAKDVADTFEARVIIEPQVARRLAGNLNSSHLSILEANLEQQKACISRGNAIEFVSWDVDFHMQLVHAHGNVDLVRMMERICERTFQAIASAFDGSVTALEPAYKAHKSIFAAIVRGDAQAAEERMSKHITSTRDLKLHFRSSMNE
jgi:DNA-binding GntR family transcriptional regulator